MGHVDHGKTSLLDYIRARTSPRARPAASRSTSAPTTSRPTARRITFLDTPGHEAFTAMRARGAKVTDIVVLVVAADDGVMPQTIEAIHHAKAAEVPIVVAVNKIDKPDADPDRVKQRTARNYELISEEWGGETLFVEVSAMTGQGIDRLLESILLQAELLDLKAAADGPATGHGDRVEPRKRPRCRRHDVGASQARCKAATSSRGRRNTAAFAPCSTRRARRSNRRPVDPGRGARPVRDAEARRRRPGRRKDERKAREVAQIPPAASATSKLAQQQAAKLENMFSQMGEGDAPNVQLIIKADVQGSAEALRDALDKMSTEEVRSRSSGSGVGGITESDVKLAAASKGVIIGFNVRADAAARERDQGSGRRHPLLQHHLRSDRRRESGARAGCLRRKCRRQIVGPAEVREVFRSPKFGNVAGCIVTEGYVGVALRFACCATTS